MSDLSYYEVLGVKEDAPAEEIKKAYRRAARANHPDSGQPGAGALFPLIQKAWDTLGDESKRAAYDRQRSAPPRVQQQPSQQTQRPEPQGRQFAPNDGAERAARAKQHEAWLAQQKLDREFQDERDRERERDHQSSLRHEPVHHKDERSLGERLKEVPRKSLVLAGVSGFLWALWATLCCIIIAGVGKDGVIFAFLAFFLTLGLTFLIVRFSRNLAPIYAFIFSAIVLPLPVAGLVTSGFSSTSWIFVVAVLGIVAGLGDYFLRRPLNALLARNSYRHSAS